MQTQTTTFTDVRRHERVATECMGRVDLGFMSCVTGTVRDWSPGGICFEPEVGYVDGEFLKGLDAVEEIEVGGEMTVSLTNPKTGRSYLVSGTVKWKGQSFEHDCPAVGIEAHEMLGEM